MSEIDIQNIIIEQLIRFNPEFVGLFGSFVRGSNSGNSDIDILVKFRKNVSLLQLVKIENNLTQKIGIKVDLVTSGALKNERIKKSIQSDLKIIYQA